MKHISIFFLFLSIYTFGQEEFRPYIGIGFHGGLNSAIVDFEPSIDQSAINVYAAGIILNYIAEKNVGLQTELNFVQRGWQDENDSLGSYSRTMNFIEIPLLTHIYIGSKFFRVTAELGPYIAFNQGFSEEYAASLIPDDPYPDSIVLGYRNYYGQDIDSKLDYGFIGGGGIGVITKFGEFQLKVRYTKSLINIFEPYPVGNFRFSSMESIYFGFSWVQPIYFNKKD